MKTAIKAPRTTLQKGLVGPAGEHYVIAMLHLQGFLAALVPKGTEKTDILVVDPLAKDVVASIQVKSRTVGSDRGWMMKDKHETFHSERMFYAFVDFEPSPINVYVVPSQVVAKAVAENHKQWLLLPGKNGKKHNDHAMRRLCPNFSVWKTYPADFPDGWMDKYDGNWQQLRQKN